MRICRLSSIPLSLLMLAVVAIGSSGCIRYVPSREELEASGAGGGNGQSAGNLATAIGGEEEFTRLEQQRQLQLEQLIRERESQAREQVDTSYRIGRGDVLDVEVFGLPDLKAQLEVSPAGTISPSLVGETAAAGLTLEELKSKLTKAYAQYVVVPAITITMKQFEAHKVSVIGAVGKPGVYPLKRYGRSLTDVLSEAGGRTELAGSRVLLIPAPKEVSAAETMTPIGLQQVSGAQASRQHGLELDIDDLYGSVEKAPVVVPLLAGDTIAVPEAGTVEVDGEVAKSGSYKISSKLTALGAVAAAGGFTYSADVNKVEVIREFGGGKKAVRTLNLEQVALNGENDLRLRNGDVVRVPSHPTRFAKRQIVEVLNGMFRFGISGRVN